MIKFTIYNNKTIVRNYNSEELEFLEKKLKFWKKNFNPDPFGNQFNVINIFNKDEQSFPTGYLETLKEMLQKEKIKFKENDKRYYPMSSQSFEKIGDLPKLYKTQKEALKEIINSPTGVIASATGSGKTRLIIETIAFRQCTTLIIVPNKSIQSDMLENFSNVFGKRNVSTKAPKNKYDYLFFDDLKKEDEDNEEESQKKDLSLGSLGNLFSNSEERNTTKKKGLHELTDLYTSTSSQDLEDPEDEYEEMGKLYKYKNDNNRLEKERKKEIKQYKKEVKPITIICFQSLPNISKKYLSEVECVIVDECHHSSSNSIRMGLLEMPNAGYRYFFSGTPWRDTKAELHLLISSIGNELLYELRGKEAVDEGIISKPIYVSINPPPPTEFLKKISKRKYREILDKGIIKNKTRNKTIVKEAMDLYTNDKNVFIAVDEIAHLEILKKRFEQLGVTPNIIFGEMCDWEKNDTIKKVGNHNGSLITIGTMAVGQGTDMPYVNAVIIASGGKSTIRFIQRIGRGSRKTTEDFMVIDFFDWFHETLIKHSIERQQTFKKEYEELSGLDHFN